MTLLTSRKNLSPLGTVCGRALIALQFLALVVLGRGQETNRYVRYIADLPTGGAFNSFFSEQVSGVANDEAN